MTMMSGLETSELDMLDEEFLGPPPRFLREMSSNYGDADIVGERMAQASFLPSLSKIRRFVSVL